MSVAFEPKAGCMLVQIIPREEKSESGIIVPTSAHSSQQTARIVRLGLRTDLSLYNDKINFRIGDRVVIDLYSGKELEFDGEHYILIKVDDVLGRLE